MSKLEEKVKLWDPILPRPPWPIPICYYPPMWELIFHRDILVSDEPIPLVKELVSDDPLPIKENMVRYYKARIEITGRLIEQRKLEPELGNRAIAHFKNHLEELEAIPINIP